MVGKRKIPRVWSRMASRTACQKLAPDPTACMLSCECRAHSRVGKLLSSVNCLSLQHDLESRECQIPVFVSAHAFGVVYGNTTERHFRNSILMLYFPSQSSFIFHQLTRGKLPIRSLDPYYLRRESVIMPSKKPSEFDAQEVPCIEG